MAQPLGVVAGGDEELAGGVVADAVHGDERRGDLVEDCLDAPVEFGDLERQGTPAPRDGRERVAGGTLGGRGDGRPPRGGDGDLLFEGQVSELGADPVRGGVR